MNHLKQFDKSFLTKKVNLLAGVDEAGRGPLAGPVVAAAVIFDKKTFHEQINDSKKITETRREELYEWIVKNCVAYGIGIIDHIEIDEINILQASLKAMKIAALQLEPKPNLILIDGNKSFVSDTKSTTVVKGDAKSFSIAAASIIAKVTRDRMMKEYAGKFSNYGWEHNKGYATKEHISAIKKHGATELHRKTFLNNILSGTQEEIKLGV
ncbi:MAG: ribonuclease HII [Ignavibacteriales bacterium]|nr:ribonuclease HII [Ignavibacteriales bacterium]